MLRCTDRRPLLLFALLKTQWTDISVVTLRFSHLCSTNTSETMTTFDDILEEAGEFGRCQKRVFALLCMVSMPWAGVYVGIVFQGYTPDHWCRDPAVVQRRQSCGWSLADSRRLTVPLVNSSGALQHSGCEQYDVDWNATSLTCDTQELDLSKTPTTACKAGWEYDYEGRQSFVTEVRLDFMGRLLHKQEDQIIDFNFVFVLF